MSLVGPATLKGYSTGYDRPVTTRPELPASSPSGAEVVASVNQHEAEMFRRNDAQRPAAGLALAIMA